MAITRSEKLHLRLTLQPITPCNMRRWRPVAVGQISCSGVPWPVLAKPWRIASFALDGPQWVAFLAALDGPTLRHPRLNRLLQEPSAFEPGESA